MSVEDSMLTSPETREKSLARELDLDGIRAYADCLWALEQVREEGE